MNPNGRDNQVLVLVHRNEVFHAVTAALEKRGFTVTDRLEEAENVSGAVLDSFFYQSKVKEYLQSKNAEMRFALALTGKEFILSPVPTLIFSPEALSQTEEWIARWSEAMKKPAPVIPSAEEVSAREFGAGLWVSLFQRIKEMESVPA